MMTTVCVILSPLFTCWFCICWKRKRGHQWQHPKSKSAPSKMFMLDTFGIVLHSWQLHVHQNQSDNEPVSVKRLGHAVSWHGRLTFYQWTYRTEMWSSGCFSKQTWQIWRFFQMLSFLMYLLVLPQLQDEDTVKQTHAEHRDEDMAKDNQESTGREDQGYLAVFCLSTCALTQEKKGRRRRNQETVIKLTTVPSIFPHTCNNWQPLKMSFYFFFFALLSREQQEESLGWSSCTITKRALFHVAKNRKKQLPSRIIVPVSGNCLPWFGKQCWE